MTSFRSKLPLCELSCRGNWTPLNRIIFSQCLDENEEKKSFLYQKKKLKRYSCPYKDKTAQRKYIVYKYVSSSESEVSSSDEFNSADKFKIRKKENLISRSCRDPEVYSSEELNSTNELEIREMEKSVNDEDQSGSDFAVQISEELSSTDKQKNNMQLKQLVKSKKYPANEGKSADKLRINTSSDDESNESHSFSDHEYRVNYIPKKRKKHKIKKRSKKEKKDLQSKNNMQPKMSVVESKKYNTSNGKYDCEWILSTSSDTASDESNSTSDYDNTVQKRKKDKIKKRNKKEKLDLQPERPQLSEYEKMVMKNRDEKMAFLESLKISEVKESFKESVKTLEGASCKKKRNKSVSGAIEKRTESGKVCRQSARVKNLLKKKEEEKAKILSEEEKEGEKESSVLPFEKAVVRGHVYYDFISGNSEPEFKVPHLLNNCYESHFKNMKLQKPLIAKLTNNTISSMAVHDSQEKIIVCAGSTSGEIIFWHVNSPFEYPCTFQPHRQSVNCLKFHPFSPNVLISSSLDGTMRHGDFEKKTFYRVFEAESCNHFDVLSSTSYLVSHGIGYMSIVDIRSPGKVFEKRHKCCEEAVKTINLHPVNKNYFISAHQKGTVKLWDLRKLTNEPVMDVSCGEEDMISSFFSPVTGNSILVTLSNTICLLDSSSLNKEIKLKRSIEHVNVSHYSPISATWLPNTDGAFAVGCKMGGRIEIFDDKLCNIFNFADLKFQYSMPVNAFHSSLPFLSSASKERGFIFSEIS